MTTTIIITLCSLLLIAYIFDFTAAKTRIPSVILLLALGWGTRQATSLLEFKIPDLVPVLPILGTIGLILIVLEGSLELELSASNTTVLKKSFLIAFLPMLVLAFILAFALQYIGPYSFKDSLANVIPLCVISSAIAIPSVKNLSARNKEFVVFESSLSDILGVLFFNFIVFNREINFESVGHFVLQLVIICLVTFVATIGLSFLLKKIDHHIKFTPIILLVILIYDVSKVYHLPGLIFIMCFGLFLGNLNQLKSLPWIDKFSTEDLSKELVKFKELTTEATFLVRSLFFLLFGFLIETEQILNTETMLWSAGVVGLIFLLRALQLKVAGMPVMPLVFVAPRGLITILLVLSIPTEMAIPFVGQSLVIQVILLTAFIMMLGLMVQNKKGV